MRRPVSCGGESRNFGDTGSAIRFSALGTIFAGQRNAQPHEELG
jgi:hypothetical protein